MNYEGSLLLRVDDDVIVEIGSVGDQGAKESQLARHVFDVGFGNSKQTSSTYSREDLPSILPLETTTTFEL